MTDKDRRYSRKNESKCRDYNFNDYKRKIERELFFRDLTKLLDKHRSLSPNDLLFVFSLVRHKLNEGKENEAKTP